MNNTFTIYIILISLLTFAAGFCVGVFWNIKRNKKIEEEVRKTIKRFPYLK